MASQIHVQTQSPLNIQTVSCLELSIVLDDQSYFDMVLGKFRRSAWMMWMTDRGLSVGLLTTEEKGSEEDSVVWSGRLSGQNSSSFIVRAIALHEGTCRCVTQYRSSPRSID